MKGTTQKKILCTILSLILAISGSFTIASASSLMPAALALMLQFNLTDQLPGDASRLSQLRL